MSGAICLSANRMNGEIQDEMVEDANRDTSPHTGDPATAHDRRRPDRIDHVSPELIPLLRDPAGGPDQDWADFERELAADADQLAPARGIFLAVVVSILAGILVWNLL